MALPTALYSTDQVRALDAYAIGTLGIPSYTLMRRAGESALRYLRARWPDAQRIAVVCGGGNNGGDGYVLARSAQAAGLRVDAMAAAPVDALSGDARQAFEDFTASGGKVVPFAVALLAGADVIVDALLGTGLREKVRESAAQVIAAINAARRPVLALDIPSGLDSDRGFPSETAVRADCTVTFIGIKLGLLNGDGPRFAGQLFFDDLQVAAPDERRFEPIMTRIAEHEISNALPRRSRSAHKGDFGRVIIVGGGIGMPGAVCLAGEACLRVGAGLVTAAVAPANAAVVTSSRPELICLPIDDMASLKAACDRADVVAIGPGLGRDDWAREVLSTVLRAARPTILDADALTLLAESTEQSLTERPWILTPHPLEAARLLGVSTADVQRDRPCALRQLVERYRCVVALKGAGTLVGAPRELPGICTRGNPGMATAGMGDVLTGAMAGILAQCKEPRTAARVAVLVHAIAGDAAARAGERGLIASDVIRELRTCVNP